jgi:hypothetical protein
VSFPSPNSAKHGRVNAVVTAIDPVRLKSALGLIPRPVEVSARVDGDVGRASVVFARTGDASAAQEVLYAVSPAGADGNQSPVFGKVAFPAGASSITIPVAELPIPPGGTGANLRVIGNGNDYIVATDYSVRF